MVKVSKVLTKQHIRMGNTLTYVVLSQSCRSEGETWGLWEEDNAFHSHCSAGGRKYAHMYRAGLRPAVAVGWPPPVSHTHWSAHSTP